MAILLQHLYLGLLGCANRVANHEARGGDQIRNWVADRVLLPVIHILENPAGCQTQYLYLAYTARARCIGINTRLFELVYFNASKVV